MSQQQNMMQDYIRTSTYQRAMLDNSADFQDKVVLDVGAGSGILSFFAIQAGARKVYAIEASSMAKHCQTLVNNNRLSDNIIVVAGKIEEVDIPEKVDVIISEPMGYMLFNERMLETFLHAKKWLKPGGKIFPTQGDLHIAPFTDEALYMEQCGKANFWYQSAFHNVDLTSLREAAVQEYFKQPIVDTFDIRICLARSHKYTVNFQTANESDLHNIEIPLSFVITQAGTIHGLAFWFDVAFLGSQTTVWLSTGPTQPLTHWYQVRCLLQTPLFVKQGQTIVGKVHLKSNKRQSYDVELHLAIPGTTMKSTNVLDLKNPFFRYTGQQPQPPPGTNHTSPSETYWNQQDLTGAVQANAFNVALLNGGMGDGSQLLQVDQAGVMYNNLMPLGNVAPIHPGSIPSPGIGASSVAQLALQSRTSIGGGISPVLLAQGISSSSGQHQNQLLTNHQYMIGDYMVPSGTLLQQPSTLMPTGTILPTGSVLPSSMMHGATNVLHYKAAGEI
jgi:histone-arginine methyltransferase CARM1